MSCKKDSTPKKHNWMKGFVITPKSKDIDHVHREQVSVSVTTLISTKNERDRTDQTHNQLLRRCRYKRYQYRDQTIR